MNTDTHDGRVAHLLVASVPGGAHVVVHGDRRDVLDELRDRGCEVEVVDDSAALEESARTADLAVMTTPLEALDDPRRTLKCLAAAVGPDGCVLVAAPAAHHLAVRLGLTRSATSPHDLRRASGVAWPATADLLDQAGLHVWWHVPVRGDLLDGTGLDASAISPEVLAELRADPDAAVQGVIVAAGLRPRPREERDVLAALVAEVDELRRSLADARALHEATEHENDSIRRLRARVDELSERLRTTEAVLAAERDTVDMRSEYVASLESRLDGTQRGFTRLALRVDRWMLDHPVLMRLHALGGRLLRALR